MAGHNKWSKVQRLTGALDAKRGKLFSNLAKETTLSAQQNGESPNDAARLHSSALTASATVHFFITRHGFAARFLQSNSSLQDHECGGPPHSYAEAA